MRITATGVSKGARGSALPETNVSFATGTATFVAAETAQRPTVLGLIVTGRMKPSTGEVLIDGEASPKALRRSLALVDAPDVSEPPNDVRLSDVIAEELMFAGRSAGPVAVRRELERFGALDEGRTTIAEVDPALRIRVLGELALERPGTGGIVLVSPDRHGGEPREWWAIACELAQRGAAVLVIAGLAARAAIDARPGGWGTGEVMPLGRAGQEEQA